MPFSSARSPEAPPVAIASYKRVDLRPHGMQQNRHQVVSVIPATPPFALFRAPFQSSSGMCLQLDLGQAFRGHDRAVLRTVPGLLPVT